VGFHCSLKDVGIVKVFSGFRKGGFSSTGMLGRFICRASVGGADRLILKPHLQKSDVKRHLARSFASALASISLPRSSPLGNTIGNLVADRINFSQHTTQQANQANAPSAGGTGSNLNGAVIDRHFVDYFSFSPQSKDGKQVGSSIDAY